MLGLSLYQAPHCFLRQGSSECYGYSTGTHAEGGELPEVSPSSLLGPEVAAVGLRHPGTWGPQTQRRGHPSGSMHSSPCLAPGNSSLLPFLLLRQQGPPLGAAGEGKSQERAYPPQAPPSILALFSSWLSCRAEGPGNIPWSPAWRRQTVPQALAGPELQDVPLGPLLRVGCLVVWH